MFHDTKIIGLYAVVVLFISTHAQIGSGWTQYDPPQRIHLDDDDGLQTFSWKEYQSVCSPICADYRFDAFTNVETFRLLDNRTNRSEIRLQNEYSTGSRQFEGYVTFYEPLNDESLMQIFGSTSGATQLMIRGYASSGGSMRGGGATLATNCYGKEMRVNVIHDQEDSGNRIRIYINGSKEADFADNERVTNYHKYGCYGTLRTSEAKVEWRNVKHFRGGITPVLEENIRDNHTGQNLSLSQTGKNFRIHCKRKNDCTVDILSCSGRTLYTKKLTGQFTYTLTIPTHLKGVYLLLVDQTGSKMVRKIIR